MIGSSQNVTNSSKSPKKIIIFQKPLVEYIKEFLAVIFFIALIPTLFAFLLIMINQGKIQSNRIGEVVHFIKIAKPIWFALMSYIVSRKLIEKWEKYGYWTFLQAIFVGTISGFILGIFLSILDFTFTFFAGNVVDSIIALLSFLWISWKYVLVLSFFMAGILGIQWVIKNFNNVKNIFGTEEEIIEDNKDNLNDKKDKDEA